MQRQPSGPLTSSIDLHQEVMKLTDKTNRPTQLHNRWGDLMSSKQLKNEDKFGDGVGAWIVQRSELGKGPPQ